MIFNLRKEKKFAYTVRGEGKPIVLLHGLMGSLSNFSDQVDFFSKNGYKVYSIELPLYSLPTLRTNVLGLTNYVIAFLQKIVILGNSRWTFRLNDIFKKTSFC